MLHMPAVNCDPKVNVKVHRWGKCRELQSVSVYSNPHKSLVLSASYIKKNVIQSKTQKGQHAKQHKLIYFNNKNRKQKHEFPLNWSPKHKKKSKG